MRKFSFQPHCLETEPYAKQSIWSIGLVCFFWTTASLMIFTLLPTFLTDELKASKVHVGFIEGFAIFLAFMAKVFSGVISDYAQKRKPLIMMGAFLTIVVKSMFAMAAHFWWIFAARASDRIIKGIRSAPTDALIADFSPPKHEGLNYGLRESLHTLGAVFGSLLASILMWTSGNNYRLVFWLALVPATLAFLILKFFVHESLGLKKVYKKKPWNLADIKQLPKPFWHLLGITFLLMLARFSEAFLTLRAKDLGWQVAVLPLLMMGYNLMSTFVAVPMGQLADKFNRVELLLFGILVLVLTNFIIIGVPHWGSLFVGMLLAGLHMGMTQGLIAAMIAESTLSTIRGTAFALYYLTTGTAVLIGNTLAGHLSDRMGTKGAFMGGLFFTTLASIYCYFVLKRQKN